MTKSIRFRAKSPQRKIYYPGDFKFSSVQSRPTLTSKEETRKKYGLPKKQIIIPLNQQFLQRMLSKSHTYECHSPEKIKKQYQTEIIYKDDLIELLLNRCTEIDSGARNVDNILNSSVLPALATEILMAMSEQKVPRLIEINVKNDEIHYALDPKKHKTKKSKALET